MIIDKKYVPSRVEIETRNRIKIAVYAFSYEFMDKSIVSDSDFDALAKKIDKSIKTNRPDLDKWFEKYFDPYTGSWIHGHPELEKIEKLYFKHYEKKVIY